MIRTALDAVRLTDGVFRAQLALADNALFIGSDTAERTDEHTGKAADAFIFIDFNYAVRRFGERAGDAAFDTDRVVAMTAVDREADFIALFYADIRRDGPAFELRHIRQSRIGKRAVVFTQMASETPFFIDINFFHAVSPLIRLRA